MLEHASTPGITHGRKRKIDLETTTSPASPIRNIGDFAVESLIAPASMSLGPEDSRMSGLVLVL
jgi:hypothetical protein